MADLHNTVMGKRLIEHTLPEIAKQLERIADILEEKHSSKQVKSAYKAFLYSGETDEEIVKQLKKIWEK